jgi:hypothetical protein
MSLIIGILVDDATVVLENIQRHLDMGKEKRTAAMDGRMEIGFSALSITLVDVVVFMPILFLQVFVADMLKQFSIVVITSTLTSLLVGFTLTPWLASRIGKKEDLQPTNFLNRFLLWFEHQLDHFVSFTTGITENNYKPIYFYPNPATNNLFINLSQLKNLQNTTVSIYDIQGKLLLHQYIQQPLTELNITQFAKGFYIVKVNNNKEILVSKFVKE